MSEQWDGMRKPRDSEMAIGNHTEAAPLDGSKEPLLLKLDITQMMPDAVARAMSRWFLGGGTLPGQSLELGRIWKTVTGKRQV